MTAIDRASMDTWALLMDQADERIAVDSVYSSIQGRSPTMRTVGMMYTKGYTETDIARRLDISQPTVSRYVHELRSTLTSLLDSSYA